jgi:hypothetical protein
MARGPSAELGVLVVEIDNQQPVPLAVVAELLSALAQDYRLFTRGRELTVESVHQGSLITFLRDLADWADQANHLFDFAKNVALLVTGAIAGTVLLRGRGRKEGSRTVVAIAEAAIKGKAPVRIMHRGRRGDTLMVEVHPTEADVIRRHRTLPPQPDYTPSSQEGSADIETIAKAAIEAVSTDQAAGIMVLLRELIRVVRQRPDGQRRLDEVAQLLRSRGYDAAAKLVETE